MACPAVALNPWDILDKSVDSVLDSSTSLVLSDKESKKSLT